MDNLDTAVDLRVLESLDFPVPCGHSQHDHSDFTHDGPAKFIAVSYHDCPGVPDSPPPYFYPCCAVWAAFVNMNSMLNRAIVCSRCGEMGFWADFVKIVDSLT
jgi:hypothetical protein